MSDILDRRPGANCLYVDPEWRQLISYNKLDFFDVIWNMPVEPLDSPNRRRGLQSFSVAGIIEVRRPDGGQARLVVKKQQNYLSRTLLHPLSGIPTFQREIANLLHFREKGLPTLRPVLFASKSEDGYSRAVLVSEYLVGYRPLSDLIESRKTN